MLQQSHAQNRSFVAVSDEAVSDAPASAETAAEMPSSSRPALAPASHCFRLRAEREPSVLSRVLEMFTLRDLIPHALTCVQCPQDAGELRIDVEVSGLGAPQAESLAARMRNVVPVISVLLEPRF